METTMELKTVNTVSEAHDVPLRVSVERALTHYLSNIGEQSISNLYQIVIDEVEEALFKFVIQHKSIKKNQSKAAILLGISRTTLRKKLKIFDMLE